MRYIVEDDGLKIDRINDSEKNDIEILTDLFSLTDAQAPQMSGLLIRDLENGKFLYPTLIQFSKWCHTGVRYIKPQTRAIEISFCLFGYIIPRLCDQQNQTFDEHIELLEQFLCKLMAEDR